MQGSTIGRTLLVSVALAFAGAATAQSTDKEASTAAKPGTAKSTKTATPKRLDFVPSGAVKQTTTRPTGATPAQLPAKQDFHCDHSQASDA